MGKATRAVVRFVAIVSVVATAPPLAIRAITLVTGGPQSTPDWWSRLCLVALGVFILAASFLVWDARQLSRAEDAGVIVDRLRVPTPRNRRRPASTR